MGDIYHAGEVYAGSVPIDDTQASEDTVYSSAKVETMMEGVQSDIEDEWVIETRTSSTITVAANETGHVEIPTTKTGYTAKGVLGIDSFSSALSLSAFRISTGNRVYIYYKNTVNASVSGQYIAVVLYKKN